jgi:hypothetical protein
MSDHIRSLLETCVDEIIGRVGKRLVIGAPLGVGKPVHLLNALYARAIADQDIQLDIVTALTLSPPTVSRGLAGRLAGPIAERLSGSGPVPQWDVDRRRGKIPPNVRIREFYLPPGAGVSVDAVQHEYVSANYHHAAEVIATLGMNVLAQLVSPIHEGTVSLGTNPDLSLSLFERLSERRLLGEPNITIGVMSSAMPYLLGDAVVDQDRFDVLIEVEDSPLFGMPNPAVDERDAVIGALAAGLVRDGGTIQVGIGSLGDGLAAALRARDRNPDAYRTLLSRIARPSDRHLIRSIGGDDSFVHGLYASTEMMSDGLLGLYRDGLIRRRVVDDVGLQHLVNAHAPGGTPTLELIRAMVDEGMVESPLTPADVRLLQDSGLLRRGVVHLGDRLEVGDLTCDPAVGLELEQLLGERLSGTAMHVAFAIGSPAFYQALRDLDEPSRADISMKDVGFTNSLLGEQDLKLAQRLHARFLNITMQMTLMGEAASDTLADGRVVSGVGGQHDFVTMGHDLPGGRSVIMGRATRTKSDGVTSNVVWSHGHPTIPRHLRDIVVTEYGIADLRGKTDAEVIAAMIEIADSRFQDDLVAVAQKSRKLDKRYTVPDGARLNRPDRYAGSFEASGLPLERFPFGRSITEVEETLMGALTKLQKTGFKPSSWPSWSALTSVARPTPDGAAPYLDRLRLTEPRSLRERAMAAAVVAALTDVGVLSA